MAGDDSQNRKDREAGEERNKTGDGKGRRDLKDAWRCLLDNNIRTRLFWPFSSFNSNLNDYLHHKFSFSLQPKTLDLINTASMKLSLVSLTLPLATVALPNVGYARVRNNCTETVWLWSVGTNISAPYRLQQGASYAEQFSRDPITGGRALKITIPENGLYTPGVPQTIFAYNLDGAGIWYDLSDVFGDAFIGKKLVVASAEPTCQKIIWPTGVPPAGSQVKVCTAEKDVTLTLCAD